MARFVSKKKIKKGWSGERKYCVTDHEGMRYLMRISDAEMHHAKEQEFRMMQRVASLGIPMCLPMEFGTCEEGVYLLQSWIDGTELEQVLPTLSIDKQKFYGRIAGQYLKKMHSIPAPKDQPDWELRFNRKIDRKIRMYRECPLSYENGEVLIDYLNANRHLLKDRPQCYQHGDYHVGNMLVDIHGTLCILDFNRWDFGDPWEEFNRIVWCAQASPAFASGMIDGYFDGEVPEKFWRLLALYVASNTLGSLPWAVPYGKKQIAVMQKQAAQVLEWYDGMTRVVPKWYQKA